MLNLSANLTCRFSSMMRSHLTRQVFRQILRNEPFTHFQCIRRPSKQLVLSSYGRTSLSWVQTRSFWWFSTKPARQIKPVDVTPGFLKLLELRRLLKMKVRTPPREEVIKAFREFFAAKEQEKLPILDTEVEPALVALQHLRKNDETGSGEMLSLSTEDLVQSLQASALSKGGEKNNSAYIEFADLLYEELQFRKDEDGSEQAKYRLANGDDSESGRESLQRRTLILYVSTLSQFGQPHRARQLLEEKSRVDQSSIQVKPFWTPVVKAFARNGDNEELESTIRLMQANGLPFDRHVHQILMMTFSKCDNMAAIKQWYGRPIDGEESPTAKANTAVVKACIEHKEFEWGQLARNRLLEHDMNKRSWDTMLRWAAATGKGVDEIERMMQVMLKKSNEAGNDVRPDIETINSLVKDANARNDPYTAERLLGVAQKWSMTLDAQTYTLQLEYRLAVGDIDGARVAFKELRAHERPENNDVPIINRFIQRLCEASEQNFHEIMDVVQDLTERKASFAPETVASLSILHLKRAEFHDAINLLRTYSFHYQLDQRDVIQSAYTTFIKDPSNTAGAAWDAYMIIRGMINESNIPLRVEIMNEFFNRRRCDMAVHVFGHMRQSSLKEGRPTVDTYAQCFRGIAKLEDEELLDTVFNMLKLDSLVEPDTKLKNALMLAFLDVGYPSQSLELWDDITFSREGPTYDSICIALQACERIPDGDRRARQIWQRLKRQNIEVTKEMCDAYVGALAGQDYLGDAVQIIQGMEADTGSRPDTST